LGLQVDASSRGPRATIAPAGLVSSSGPVPSAWRRKAVAVIVGRCGAVISGSCRPCRRRRVPISAPGRRPHWPGCRRPRRSPSAGCGSGWCRRRRGCTAGWRRPDARPVAGSNEFGHGEGDAADDRIARDLAELHLPGGGEGLTQRDLRGLFGESGPGLRRIGRGGLADDRHQDGSQFADPVESLGRQGRRPLRPAERAQDVRGRLRAFEGVWQERRRVRPRVEQVNDRSRICGETSSPPRWRRGHTTSRLGSHCATPCRSRATGSGRRAMPGRCPARRPRW